MLSTKIGILGSRPLGTIRYRSLSFLSKLKIKSNRDISEEVSNDNLPKGTGNGPFIELPTFKPLGNPSDLLNVTLPQSSKLNIRNGAIIGLNGDLKTLSSNPQILHKTEYQELLSNSSVSLLISGGMNNYSIIEINNIDEKWTLLNDENIVAWTGYDLKLKPIEVLASRNSFQTEGKGIIVVNGDEQLYDITLGSNEQIIINPSSLIGYNSAVSYTTLKGPWAQLLNLSNKIRLPSIVRPYTKKVKTFFNLQYSKLVLSIGIHDQMNTIATYWRTIKQFVSLNVINMLYSKPIYFRVSGPGRLLLDNNVQLPNRKTFTKKEINNILRS